MMAKYALHAPEHGKSPSYRCVPDDHQPEEGEVLVEEVPEESVWDEAAEKLRPRTDGEKLEEAKAGRINELAEFAVEELAVHFTDGHGREEALHLIAVHVVEICRSLGVGVDARLSEMAAAGTEAMSKKAEIEAAKTREDLEKVDLSA